VGNQNIPVQREHSDLCLTPFTTLMQSNMVRHESSNFWKTTLFLYIFI